VLQDFLLRLDKAYQAFFKKMAKYPKFKRKGKYYSFSYPQYGGFRFKEDKLILPCIGAIEIRMHRILVGTLKRCTITRDVDQWYGFITADDGVEKLEQYPVGNAVGIDVGLLNWLVLNNGETIDNPLNFKAQAKVIKNLQRSLLRKKQGSKNRAKARCIFAKAWRKIRRQRDDFVHRTSKQLANNHDTIIFEKLNINNMVKNHSLAQAIMDATWGKLREYTAYKVERRGGQVMLVNPNGTSQKCSRCGVVAETKLDLSERMFECHSCGLVTDRGLNAAINILKLGLEQALAEQPILVRQRISKFASRKQEVHK
jgi:putative transposase